MNFQICFKVPPIHTLHIQFFSSSFPQSSPSLSLLSFSLYLSNCTSMAALDLKAQHDNKENVSPSEMTITSVKPLDSSSSIDKDKTQIRIRRKRSRRQPLKDITNLFVSSSPLSSSFLIRHFSSSPTLSVDPKCMKRRSVVALKASSTFSCRNFR
ncbi:uncharacterized protein LOC103860996 [Brassica rapa]|nr:uncharacterized protein LOC106440179 [Brassica napus]XP_033144290.1 uncharacterized protein LOC103860996 [Brassica rapa]KAH0935201.1 hypothetical protein HID58_012318 [Brassica napus]CAF2130299.1 unnamed protein product [Brassica napus]CAG7883833.1 unnamed protein product [Brassica rapa]